ncbi:YkgJ family cysteine cluster protein [Methanoplanus endosymbiosus]|uniref:YkgJ family cysteine cluster protein n=1 Tax=Methanoplanus endosymbiosus TaxID=33865 RepID=A0A9E7PQH2_9EURY|nr:YkgJ family cysteine cluster protein [Methanoplanus endosymbiosus]UUX93512.1 YkgJ family cysteine cluster protein [Methanoplanus endosymbiosus]
MTYFSEESEEITSKILKTGFKCTLCGDCCRRVSEDSNLVLVSAPEIRKIMKETGLLWDEIAEPYPDFLKNADGTEYTFNWALRREGSSCIFLNDSGRCRIYDIRPDICRTYPFMIQDDELLAFECPGIGEKGDKEDTRILAEDLINRKENENEDFRKIKENYLLFNGDCHKKNKRYVIDSEGAKIIE